MAKTTRHLILATIEQSIEIEASPARVWEVLSDLRRISRWSPQVFRSFVPGGGDVRLGTRLVNINHRGFLFWPTRSEVVRFEEGREIAWKILENGSTWSFALTQHGTSTTVVHRREAPDGLSEKSIYLTDKVLGGQPAFQADLQLGMRHTLAGIKQAAEN